MKMMRHTAISFRATGMETFYIRKSRGILSQPEICDTGHVVQRNVTAVLW